MLRNPHAVRFERLGIGLSEGSYGRKLLDLLLICLGHSDKETVTWEYALEEIKQHEDQVFWTMKNK